jgi:hypothetical protein
MMMRWRGSVRRQQSFKASPMLLLIPETIQREDDPDEDGGGLPVDASVFGIMKIVGLRPRKRVLQPERI